MTDFSSALLDRWVFSLSSNVSNTVSKATDYLKSGQPGQAAVVLDALTVVLLAADNDRYIMICLRMVPPFVTAHMS